MLSWKEDSEKQKVFEYFVLLSKSPMITSWLRGNEYVSGLKFCGLDFGPDKPNTTLLRAQNCCLNSSVARSHKDAFSRCFLICGFLIDCSGRRYTGFLPLALVKLGVAVIGNPSSIGVEEGCVLRHHLGVTKFDSTHFFNRGAMLQADAVAHKWVCQLVTLCGVLL